MATPGSSDEAACVAKMKEHLSHFSTDEGRRAGLAFQPHPSDVLVVTTPKAGTTWMQQICHQLRTGGDEDFEEISAVVPWLELAYDLGQAAAMEPTATQKGTPRVFKTHFWYDHCPKGGRNIVVVRSPYDVALSFYKFFEGWFFEPGTVSLDTFVREFWLKRGVPQSDMENASYFEHFVSWWPHRNEENVLLVFFEDMKADLRATVRRVAEFMGLAADDERLIDLVVERSSFKYMSENEHLFDEKLTKRARNGPCGLPADAGSKGSKIRDGSAGRGKLALSDDLRAEIDAKWQRVKDVTGYGSYEELRKACSPLQQQQ
eukprot:m.124568 g.124568  ORF g.124568 m.124568 type:complete len:318 (+) comp9674_c2_seq2:4556-5509(+)